MKSKFKTKNKEKLRFKIYSCTIVQFTVYILQLCFAE